MEQLAISVVVPTCGRPQLLARCLAAVCGQSLSPQCYEVIVVDDRPSARTAAVVDRMRGVGPPVRYLANHGPHGPAAARNLGWRAARGAVVAFTDDDTVASTHWLAFGAAAFRPSTAAVCGRVVVPLDDRPTDYERDAARLEGAEFITANCFCRRIILLRLGGFDERFRLAWREDSDLHFRLLGMGAEVVAAPRALVLHPVRPARWGVSVAQQRKMVYDALLYKKHPRLYRERIRARPRWDYYAIVALLLTVPLALAGGAAPLALAAGAGWTAMTGRYCMERLCGTTKSVAHVAEMICTSAIIPPCAVFWRAVGAVRFRAALA